MRRSKDFRKVKPEGWNLTEWIPSRKIRCIIRSCHRVFEALRLWKWRVVGWYNACFKSGRFPVGKKVVLIEPLSTGSSYPKNYGTSRGVQLSFQCSENILFWQIVAWRESKSKYEMSSVGPEKITGRCWRTFMWTN